MRTESKCLNCTDRYRGCHMVCEKYKEYKEKLAYIKQKKQEDRERYPIFYKQRKVY